MQLRDISNIWLLSLKYEKRMENEKDDDSNKKKTEHKDKIVEVEKYQYKFKYYVFFCLSIVQTKRRVII